MNELLSLLERRFSTFGGGKSNPDNFISVALQDKPLQFAAGVDVKSVIATIIIASFGRVMFDAVNKDGDVLKAIDDFLVDIQTNL